MGTWTVLAVPRKCRRLDTKATPMTMCGRPAYWRYVSDDGTAVLACHEHGPKTAAEAGKALGLTPTKDCEIGPAGYCLACGNHEGIPMGHCPGAK